MVGSWLAQPSFALLCTMKEAQRLLHVVDGVRANGEPATGNLKQIGGGDDHGRYLGQNFMPAGVV
jgi:hypothetical protein